MCRCTPNMRTPCCGAPECCTPGCPWHAPKQQKRPFEELTVTEFWELYLKGNPPPPSVEPEFIDWCRQLYVSGFGGMLILTERLLEIEPERAKRVVAILKGQILEPITLSADNLPC